MHVKQSSLIVKSKRKDLERTRQVARPVLPYTLLSCLNSLSFFRSALCFFKHKVTNTFILLLYSTLSSFFFCPACWILLHRYSAPRRTTIDYSPPSLIPSKTYSHTHTSRLHLTHPALSSCYANEPQE